MLCYSSEGKFETIEEARKNPEKFVSSSWKALGEGVGIITNADALVVEVATRTTSFIPIKGNKVVSIAQNDFDRIKNMELLFYGLLETNAAFIENTFTDRDKVYFLPFENHANTADIFMITNDMQSSDYFQELCELFFSNFTR